MPTIRPFQVSVDDVVLERIRGRVADFAWPHASDLPAWTLGADDGFMRRLQRHWLDTYDWRVAEKELNQQPQYIADVDGLDIHFIHAKGQGPNPIPLLLIHGWPGSIFEFYELIPRLTDPGRFGLDPAICFDVIAPSLPGFGFSGKPSRPIGGQVASEYLHKLMVDGLGYDRYFAHGGDWGSLIAAWLGFNHPDHCRAIYLNLIGVMPGGEAQGLFGQGVAALRTADELRWGRDTAAILAQGGAYISLQGTRPQSLAFAMRDSPLGVAAWILERFHEWSDLTTGTVEEVYGYDRLLTNVMIYLVTNSFNTASWMYFGGALEKPAFPTGERVEVPVGLGHFPCDFWGSPPRSYTDQGYNIVREKHFPRGGHFAAMEVPDLLAEELGAFFGEHRDA